MLKIDSMKKACRKKRIGIKRIESQKEPAGEDVLETQEIYRLILPSNVGYLTGEWKSNKIQMILELW